MLKPKTFLSAAIGAITMFFAFSLSSSSAYAVESTITVSISDSSLVLDLLPRKTNGDFVTSNNISIGINLTGPGGYTLGIRANNTGANATKLINTTDSTKYFTSISSAVSTSDFSEDTTTAATNYNNKWGYLPSKINSSANTSYQPAPNEDGDILDSTSGTDDTGSYTVSIGARANLDTATGSYNNTFVIIAVANFSCNPNATNINEALCMQDMNDDVINSMVTGKQYRLSDNRDWKQYYIAKMKDGRVWMTQNLDLDLETSPSNVSALTSENTDLTTFGSQNYTSANGYTCKDSGGNDITSTTSNNCTSAGDVISWVPATATSTTASDWGSNSSTLPRSFDYQDHYYYTDTSGSTKSYVSEAACLAEHNDGTCQHFHMGNYYNFTAAVASNSTSGFSSGQMGNSICPAGWRLPNGRTSSTSTDMGYYSELNYTLVAQGIMSEYVATVGSTSTAYATDGWKNLSNSPLYFVRGGYKTGTSYPGSQGGAYYRTNTLYSSSYSYGYYFTSTRPYPLYASTYANRGYGLPVRCVAKQNNTGSTVITFNKNADDATGTTSNQTINANSFGNISNNSFARSGYAFNSWNTEPDGSGITYAEGAKYYAITGTATTNVTLYAQWDKTYTITFKTADANTTGIYFDGVKYTNGQTVQAAEGKTYSISGDYATKYGFYSWSTTAGAIAAQQPVTTYTVSTSNTTITLTGQEATVNMNTLTTTSDPVSSTCANDPVTPTLVYDPRDNEAYWVARLCDGNYWMLDNLRLDLTNSTVINNLSTSNTNADADSLTSLKSGNRANGNQYATAGLSGSNWTSGYSYSVPQVNVSGSATISNYWSGSYTKDTVAPDAYGLGSGKIGIFYNYCAASAGSFCYGNGTSESGNIYSDPVPDSQRDIASDICPKGWRLPTSQNEKNLVNKYSSANVGKAEAFKNALSTLLSGSISSGTPSSLGYAFSTFDSTWNDSIRMGGFYYDLASPSTISTTNQLRSRGNSVRCIRYDPVSVTVNFVGGGIDHVELSNNTNGDVITVTTSGSTVTLDRNNEYSVAVVSSARYAVTDWSATAGSPTSSNRAPITYVPSNNATITITSQQATTDMTSLTASSDPVSSNCKNETVTPILVYDPRDNEAYWVARLCDGKYWMLDNLRLDLSKALDSYSGDDKITLSTTNTNASAQALSCLLTGSYGGNTCTGSYSTAAVQTKTLSGGSWSNSYNLPYIATSGTCADASYYAHDPSTNQWTADSVSPVTYGPGSGKIGVYYNYCAASAGSYCYASNTQTTDPNTTTSPTARDIESDICPAGWRMPTGGSYNATTGGGDYQNLYNKYGSHALFTAALSTPLSGYFDGGSAYNQGNYGRFWSSTWVGASYMYYLLVNSSSVYPSDYGGRNGGGSVRCVLGS